MKTIYKRIRIENIKRLPFTFFLSLLNFLIIPLSIFCIWYIKIYLQTIAENFCNFGRCVTYSFCPKVYHGLKNYCGNVCEEDLVKYKAGTITNTPNFLAIKTVTKFDIFSKNDVVWIYESKDTQTLTTKFGSPISYYQRNEIIFATNRHKKYKTLLYATNGTKIIQKIDPASMTQIENDLKVLNPNLVIGYNAELNKRWQNHIKRKKII